MVPAPLTMKREYWMPVHTFSRQLKSALSDGIVGKHKSFWQSVVNRVVELMADDEYVVRQVMRQSTLYKQVDWLCAEATIFPSNPMTKTHNRFKLVKSLFEALKETSHPDL